MFNPENIFHSTIFDALEKPIKFTYPHNYTPHPWVETAADEVKDYLKLQTDFNYNFGWDDASVGKMFGILIVENSVGKLGYLAAFSGKINESNELPGFVPPIFDILNPLGFFKLGELELNDINQQIVDLENCLEYIELKNNLKLVLNDQKEQLRTLRNQHKQAKQHRDLKRKEILSQPETISELVLQQLIEESKQNHFEFKDQKRKWQHRLKTAEDELKEFEKKIEILKHKRKLKSAELQAQIHNAYHFLNSNFQTKSLLEVFEPYDRMPPAGAGECAAPRLLQYAFQNKLKPIAMGEFWWGKSPNAEVRKQGEFYPACKSKCEPILNFMLEGLNVDENPVLAEVNFELDIMYEDEHLLVVNKPAGVLSVPGKEMKTCLAQKIEAYLSPQYVPLLVHRLDMATSGLVLVAKTMDIYKDLQKQFTERKVNKTYTAILEGNLTTLKGKIELPLRVDLDNRPMQLVCDKHGKSALTYFQVIGTSTLGTRILFFPITGRTHQLRVHAAHHQGLGTPILGDDLYGKSKDRLYLHATTLEFTHPITHQVLKITSTAPF